MAGTTTISSRGSPNMASSMRIIWIAAAIASLVICFQLSSSIHRSSRPVRLSKLSARTDESPSSRCELIGIAKDQCKWVHEQCLEEQAGLLSYLKLYYCNLGNLRFFALLIILSWLLLLFSTIGIAASDFFSVNLNTIATLLGLSEDLAGVTFLAFGNGSPDVFSTFAAMSTHSGSMAIGELIGAAGFITAVVAGSMALIRPFKVSKAGFIRDVSFFICASVLTMVLLADGKLMLWECAVMVTFYLLYVLVVFLWHWFIGRRNARFAREARARGHFLVQEEFDDERATPNTRNIVNDTTDGTLTPLAHQDSFASLESSNPQAHDDSLDAHPHQQAAADIKASMRINQPRTHSRRPTGNPIRPSLVGALEFRAVLSSLQKSRSQTAQPISLRRYSDDPSSRLLRRQGYTARVMSDSEAASSSNEIQQWLPYHDDGSADTRRDRAVSTNDLVFFPSKSDASAPIRSGIASPLSLDTTNIPIESREDDFHHQTGSSSLQPPDATDQLASTTNPSTQILRSDTGMSDSSNGPRPGQNQRVSSGFLLTPGTAASSPAVPFPTYYDDPLSEPPVSRQGSFKLPPPRIDLGVPSTTGNIPKLDLKPIRWWPYEIMPEPDIFFSTLFPTLYRWNSKTFGERVLGILSAPSVFLLTITLPVVEAKRDDMIDANETHGDPTLPIVNVTEPETPTEVEAPLISIEGPSEDGPPLNEDNAGAQPRGDLGALAPLQSSHPMALTSVLSLPLEPSQSVTDDGQSVTKGGWNRWLVCVQVFMGPFFVILVFWANTDESGSLRELVIAESYAMIVSLLVLALILLTTDPIQPPRWRPLLCFVGFVVSVAWISTIANEVVGVLKAFGVMFGISEAILGLTIFAVGSSLGDLVADITIARLGFPVMAFSACIGGPMLNILLGIGLGGLYMTIKEAREAGVPATHLPFEIEVGSTLLISCIALLVTLLGLLVAVPLNQWQMDRRIGIGLISIWVITTGINLAVEVAGMGEPERIGPR